MYFAGDTMLIPELAEITERRGPLDVAVLTTNGLRIRPPLNRQVVMGAAQSAELTAQLKPAVAIPHHYAFTAGAFGDRFVTKSDRDPEHYREAGSRLAPTGPHP